MLDYCCDNCNYTRWVTEVGAEGCGIDISPVSIQNAVEPATAKGVVDHATFRVVDAEATEFPDGFLIWRWSMG